MKHYTFKDVGSDNTDTLNLLVHGLGSSRNEWIELNQYTKGGNLTELLERNNMPYLAIDLYGHGGWLAEEDDFDAGNISDELWPKFVERSVLEVSRLVNDLSRMHGYTKLNIYTYSGGGIIGLKVINKLTVAVESVFMGSPTPERDYDDEYSLHNNFANLIDCDVFWYCGDTDEFSSKHDVEWCFGQLHCRRKMLRWYQAGHSLPLQWVTDCVRDWRVNAA
jgi:pimeloyl-ACP methyl ester carboxylesterase